MLCDFQTSLSHTNKCFLNFYCIIAINLLTVKKSFTIFFVLASVTLNRELFVTVVSL